MSEYAITAITTSLGSAYVGNETLTATVTLKSTSGFVTITSIILDNKNYSTNFILPATFGRTNYLFAVTTTQNSIVKIDSDTYSVIDTEATTNAFKITCDNDNIWIANSSDDKIRKYDLDYNLIETSTFTAPGLIQGMCIDDTFLYFTNTGDNSVYRTDKETMTTATFLFAMTSPRSITCDADALYIAEWSDGRIYKFTKSLVSDGSVVVATNVSAVTVDNAYVYALGYNGINPTYMQKIDKSNMTIVGASSERYAFSAATSALDCDVNNLYLYTTKDGEPTGIYVLDKDMVEVDFIAEGGQYTLAAQGRDLIYSDNTPQSISVDIGIKFRPTSKGVQTCNVTFDSDASTEQTATLTATGLLLNPERDYKIKARETWEKLSNRFYGSNGFVDFIIESNPHLTMKQKKGIFAPAGIWINVPSVSDNDLSEEDEIEELTPWYNV